MKKLISIQIICLVLFSGLHTSQAQDIKKHSSYREIQVDPMDFTERKLTEVSSSIRYVKLESPIDTYFEYSPKILSYDNKIYIKGGDPRGEDYICCFDGSGKYSFKIQRKGKGPGEYNQISDFLIDTNKKLIVVLDRNSGKLIRYDLNGSFVDEIITSVKADRFSMIGNTTYLTYASLPFKLENQASSDNFYLLNSSGSVAVDPLIPKDPVLDNLNDGFITSNGRSTWFGCGYRDTIFQLDNSGKLTGGYYLYFGSKQVYFLKKLKSLIGSKELQGFINSYIGYSSLFRAMALKDKLLISYSVSVNSTERKNQTIILDLVSNSKIQATGQLINDYDGAPLFGAPPGCTTENELIYIIDNEQLTKAAKVNKSPEFQKTYEKIKPLTESDNPVLAFVRLK